MMIIARFYYPSSILLNIYMRELLDALYEAQKEHDDCVTLTIDSNCAERFKRLLTWVQGQAAMGTGVTITAEDNGGEKEEIYIDGDGPDRIYDIK